jgi:hypothetical protein
MVTSMAEDLKTLVEMHDLAAECRRVAIDVADSEISRKLVELAGELEQHIRGSTFEYRRKLDG